jgi:hypothetical protein
MGSEAAMTMFALKTEADARFPPVFDISLFNASMLDLLIASIGLSLESKIGLVPSFSESGGVGGDGKGPDNPSLLSGEIFGCWCLCICALECRVLGPVPPAGNLARAHGTPSIAEKKSVIAELEYVRAVIASPHTRDERERNSSVGT